MPAARFRKKPVEIEAIKWTGDVHSLAQFVGSQNWTRADARDVPWTHEDDAHLVIWNEPEQAWIPVPVGHWIIRGVAGEFYPCAPDIFEQTYEPVRGTMTPATAPEDDDLARANSEIRLLHQELRETQEALDEARRERVDLVAKFSEARTAVPEPLVKGEVQDAIHSKTAGGDPYVVLRVFVPDGEYEHLLDAEVGIWPADLAEQVCDTELDREGLQRDLAAMTAVARRLRRGESANWGFWYAGEDRAPDYLVTEPERRALEALEASDGA